MGVTSEELSKSCSMTPQDTPGLSRLPVVNKPGVCGLGHAWKLLRELGNRWGVMALHCLVYIPHVQSEPAYVLLRAGEDLFELHWSPRAGVSELL